MKFDLQKHYLAAVALALLINMPLVLADGHIHDPLAGKVSCEYCSYTGQDWIDTGFRAHRVEPRNWIRQAEDLQLAPVLFTFLPRPRGPPYLC
jgi:hypothetical protein